MPHLSSFDDKINAAGGQVVLRQLRELSKRDTKRVRRFLTEHGEKLSGVARREATKYLEA